MLRTLTINLIRCRRIKFAESFSTKYKYSSVSRTHQSKKLAPITVNGQYLAENTDNIDFVWFIYILRQPSFIFFVVISAV